MTTTVEWQKWNALQTKPITNYDRIVSKSPEELATWLGDMLGVYPFGTEQWNRQAWLDWLKQEADHDKR